MRHKVKPIAKPARVNVEVENPVTPPENAAARWWCAGIALAAVVGFFYWENLLRLGARWANEEEYSHGFLVIPFAVYLLWHRRHLAEAGPGGRWLGILLLAVSGAFRLGAAYWNYPLADTFSLLPCLFGVAFLLGGWSMVHWCWPALAFLVFMIPLPGVVAERLSGPLQSVATLCGTYLLQTCGVPAAAIGNVIHLSNPPPIMVVEACSGLRMLVAFLAITIGAAFVVDWGLPERIIIVLSGIPIAVAANVFRITTTGLAQEYFGAAFADKVFHDFAGWLMMPIAFLLVALELWLLSRVFPRSEGGGLVVAGIPAVHSPG